VFLVLFTYWIWIYHNSGVPLLKSFFWFEDPNFQFTFKYSLFLFFPAYLLGAWVSSAYFILRAFELSEFEELDERKRELQESVKELSDREGELRRSIEDLERRKGELESCVEGLEVRERTLSKSFKELEEKKRSLDVLIREAVERGYKEGWERAYQKVITELQSLRAQKSTLVDLFTKEKELRDVFKRVTGKKFLQYLKDVKRSKNESVRKDS